MKYMLLVYMAEDAMTDDERESCYGESAQLARDLHANGQFVAASPLHLISSAASVRMREGKHVITDGPFAETREQLGGYYIVDVKNRREAVAIAARIPAARYGTIEVRPIMEIPGLPED